MHRFTAYRPLIAEFAHSDAQANDAEAPQYEGIVFSDGTCVIRWLTAVGSTSVFDSLDSCMIIHGHPEYGTRIDWHDGPLPLPWDNRARAA